MNIAGSFHVIEKNIGNIYPENFYVFLEDFLKLVENKNIKLFFKKFHFCNQDEIEIFTENNIADGFTPFFAEEQNGFCDYYCIDKNGSKNKREIIAISSDEIVSSWGSYDDFLDWVRCRVNNCND